MSLLYGPEQATVDPSNAAIDLAARAGLRPIRLLKFLAILAIGGSERQALLLGKALDRSRFDLHLGCCLRTSDNIEDVLSARGVPITEYAIKNLYGLRTLRQRVRLAQYLRRERIDILHSYNYYSNIFAIPAARMAGVPVVIAAIRDNGHVWTAMQRRVERIMCRLADRVLVNAEIIKTRLIAEGYDESKITVIHNGTDVPPVWAPSRDTAIRKELNLPRGAPLVGVIARLDPIKGIQYFIRAAVLVTARRPDVRFLIVGDNRVNGAYREELKRLAAHLGLNDLVRFVGFRNDVSDVLSSLAVSVLPSLSEGLSNTLLESMAYGVPVVATAVGGTPEVVEDGVTGFLVPPKDPIALGQAICRLLEDPCHATAMGQAGQERIVSRFSNDRMVAETEQVYHELLQNAHMKATSNRLHRFKHDV